MLGRRHVHRLLGLSTLHNHCCRSGSCGMAWWQSTRRQVAEDCCSAASGLLRSQVLMLPSRSSVPRHACPSQPHRLPVLCPSVAGTGGRSGRVQLRPQAAAEDQQVRRRQRRRQLASFGRCNVLVPARSCKGRRARRCQLAGWVRAPGARPLAAFTRTMPWRVLPCAVSLLTCHVFPLQLPQVSREAGGAAGGGASAVFAAQVRPIPTEPSRTRICDVGHAGTAMQLPYSLVSTRPLAHLPPPACSRGPDQLSVKAACDDLGVALIAYSPLALGAPCCCARMLAVAG